MGETRGKYDCYFCGQNLPPYVARNVNVEVDGQRVQAHHDERQCIDALRAECARLRGQYMGMTLERDAFMRRVEELEAAPPVPAVAVTEAQRDYADDGSYAHVCGICRAAFTGGKRRNVCRVCLPAGEELRRLRLTYEPERVADWITAALRGPEVSNG